jgi:hypothetical protein
MSDAHRECTNEEKDCRHGVYAVAVSIERPGETEPVRVEGELSELRRGGGKVVLSETLRFAENIRLHMMAPHLNIDLSTEAHVCHLARQNDDKWSAWLSFPAEVSERLQAMLAKRGCLDQRRDVRHRCRISARATWHSENLVSPVEIHDYSLGGFCLISPGIGELGSHCSIELDSSERAKPVRGRVRWQFHFENKTVVGCVFVDVEDFDLLKVVADRNIAKGAALPAPSACFAGSPWYRRRVTVLRQLVRWKWTGMIVTLLAVLLFVGRVCHNVEGTAGPGRGYHSRQCSAVFDEYTISASEDAGQPDLRASR